MKESFINYARFAMAASSVSMSVLLVETRSLLVSFTYREQDMQFGDLQIVAGPGASAVAHYQACRHSLVEFHSPQEIE